ncbi:helix-turn-helix domain-containing protein [bacterium]|nr:helix-turn-helix domain-containing protein [bacterium]
MDKCKFLSVSEAASYLGYSKWTIYDLTRNRRIKYYKGKRFIRFLQEDLDRFLEVKYLPIDVLKSKYN